MCFENYQNVNVLTVLSQVEVALELKSHFYFVSIMRLLNKVSKKHGPRKIQGATFT